MLLKTNYRLIKVVLIVILIFSIFSVTILGVQDDQNQSRVFVSKEIVKKIQTEEKVKVIVKLKDIKKENYNFLKTFKKLILLAVKCN